MSYSERQQHCLQAMGIVPWVSRFATAPEADAPAGFVPAPEAGVVSGTVPPPEAAVRSGTDPAPEVDVVSATVPATGAGEGIESSLASAPSVSSTAAEKQVPDPASPVATDGAMMIERPPADVESLGGWLQSRPLAPIAYRGVQHPALGNSEAALFVVLAQQDCSPESGVMTGDDARLFELMLRAIDMSNRDTRRCLLGRAGQGVAEIGIDSLITNRTRALLVVMEEWPFDVDDIAVDRHRARYPSPALPLWRIPHPGVLLREPQLKRQAWQVLKQVREVLGGQSF